MKTPTQQAINKIALKIEDIERKYRNKTGGFEKTDEHIYELGRAQGMMDSVDIIEKQIGETTEEKDGSLPKTTIENNKNHNDFKM